MTMRNLRRWGARLFARDPQIMGWLFEQRWRFDVSDDCHSGQVVMRAGACQHQLSGAKYGAKHPSGLSSDSRNW